MHWWDQQRSWQWFSWSPRLTGLKKGNPKLSSVLVLFATEFLSAWKRTENQGRLERDGMLYQSNQKTPVSETFVGIESNEKKCHETTHKNRRRKSIMDPWRRERPKKSKLAYKNDQLIKDEKFGWDKRDTCPITCPDNKILVIQTLFE